MIRNVLVFSNLTKDPDHKHTSRLIDFLSSMGAHVYMFDREPLPGAEYLEEGRSENLDLAIALGGDGTMIRCGHKLQGSGVPVIGINLGTLGYLTEIELDSMEDSVRLALSGSFTVEERVMLEAKIGDDPKRYTAINDIVIHRDLSDGILTLRCDINKHFLAEFRADGVIVATPCGSTAYNFSAGGPILNPVSDNLILTPLCSHAMLDRSVVLRGEDELDFYIGGFTKEDHALFIADGGRAVTIPSDTWIHVKKSRFTFPLARVTDRSFYEIVQRKMRP